MGDGSAMIRLGESITDCSSVRFDKALMSTVGLPSSKYSSRDRSYVRSRSGSRSRMLEPLLQDIANSSNSVRFSRPV